MTPITPRNGHNHDPAPRNKSVWPIVVLLLGFMWFIYKLVELGAR